MYIGSTFGKDIKELNLREAYEYLGIEESHDIEHENEKEKFKKEYVWRLRLVLGTELSPENKFEQLGHWQYQYCDIVLELLTGAKKELQKLDRKMRKLLTTHRHHHSKADVDRLYVPKKQGGRGLMQLREACTVEITKLVKYSDRRKIH